MESSLQLIRSSKNRMVIDKRVEALAARMCDKNDKEDATVIGSIENLSEAVEKAIKDDIDRHLNRYIYEYQMKHDTSLDTAVDWFVESSGKYWEILDKVIDNAKKTAHAESTEA